MIVMNVVRPMKKLMGEMYNGRKERAFILALRIWRAHDAFHRGRA